MGAARREHAALTLGIFWLLLLATTPVSTVYQPPPPAAGEEHGHAVGDRGLPDPIQVDLVFLGAPELGRPSELGVQVVSHWGDLDYVEVDFETPLGFSLSSNQPAPRSLQAMVERRWSLTLLPETQGLLRVAVRVSGVSGDFGRVGGLGVLFLDIPQIGPGSVHRHNPPGISPASSTVEVPVRPAERQERTVATPTPAPAVGSGVIRRHVDAGPALFQPQSHATFNVTGQWNYWLEDDVTAAPQRWATVKVWDEDLADADDLLWEGLTDEGGNFTSAEIPRNEESPRGNQDVYVEFISCNFAVCVQATDGTNYSWVTETTTVTSEDTLGFGPRASTSNEFAQRPFHYINNGWDYATTFGGLGPVLGRVRVFIPDACTFYTRPDDTIHLCADGVDDKSPDDVNHEYGHYVQDKMYGDSFWPSPGGPHAACGDGQNRGLAWTEGFADFFGPRANREIVDPTDRFYRRPWDGSIFTFDLESAAVCAPTVRGDDNELRVATSLWDLADELDDGPLDLGINHSAAVIFGAISGCNQSTYRGFYDQGLCHWVGQGNSRFNFLATAFQNTIDYNLAPITQVTSPMVFVWTRGTLLMMANATDPDTNVTQVEFRISTDTQCSEVDVLAGMDTAPPYTASFETLFLPDGPDYWVCARASDEMEVGAWALSSSNFGIDNRPPNTVANATGTLGPGGWYVAPVTIRLVATDETSGVASLSYSLDGAAPQVFTGPFDISEEGIHTISFSAVDEAGNQEANQILEIMIDLRPPVILIVNPTAGAFVPVSGVRVEWTVDDAGAGVASCSVRLDDGPAIAVGSRTSHFFPGVPDGAHRTTVLCADLLDQQEQAEVSFTVDTNPLSPTGPLGPVLIIAVVLIALLLIVPLLRRRRRRQT